MTVADFRPYSKVKPNVNVCLKADLMPFLTGMKRSL